MDWNISLIQYFVLAYMYMKKIFSILYRFLEDLDEGVYIQQTLESVLLNDDGKQLMVWKNWSLANYLSSKRQT